MLISLYGEEILAAQNSNLKDEAYFRISDALKSKFGIDIKLRPIRDKIYTLKRHFRDEYNAAAKPGGQPSRWVHFDALASILSKSKKFIVIPGAVDGGALCAKTLDVKEKREEEAVPDMNALVPQQPREADEESSTPTSGGHGGPQESSDDSYFSNDYDGASRGPRKRKRRDESLQMQEAFVNAITSCMNNFVQTYKEVELEKMAHQREMVKMLIGSGRNFPL